MTEEQARKAFEQVQVNDNRKNEWALRIGYQMIRIRYNEPVTKRLINELL